jgi:hypothetical protein
MACSFSYCFFPKMATPAPNVLLVANARTFSRAAPLEIWFARWCALLPDQRLDVLVVGNTAVDAVAARLKAIAEARRVCVRELSARTDEIRADDDAILSDITHAVALWDGAYTGMISVINLLRDRKLLLKAYTYSADIISYSAMRQERRKIANSRRQAKSRALNSNDA